MKILRGVFLPPPWEGARTQLFYDERRAASKQSPTANKSVLHPSRSSTLRAGVGGITTSRDSCEEAGVARKTSKAPDEIKPGKTRRQRIGGRERRGC